MSRVPEERRPAGDAAEDAAEAYLAKKGMETVGRNVRAGGGEIDIVMRDGGTLVFVEVRFRESEEFGTPEESIDQAKRLKVVRAARGYLSGIPASSWTEARFDVVAVVGNGETRVIRHHTSAFDGKGKVL